MVAPDARTAIVVSQGQSHDDSEGGKLLNRHGQQHGGLSLIMNRVYQRGETRQLALAPVYEPVVPPLRTRRDPGEHAQEMYNRSIFPRFEKLVVFLGFIVFASIVDGPR